jgi:hypothetical protein
MSNISHIIRGYFQSYKFRILALYCSVPPYILSWSSLPALPSRALINMRSLSIPVSSFLLVILLGVVAPASGSPQNSVQDAANGGSGSGIPTVYGAKNAACKPWYAIRDAIMGGIYHGIQFLAVPMVEILLTTPLKVVVVTRLALLSVWRSTMRVIMFLRCK